jgi:hypothetical protein
MIDLAGLKFSGRWHTLQADDVKGVGLGTGAPAVDLVVREKSPTEKFIFVLNQGGQGTGLIEVPVAEGTWRAEDVIAPDSPVEGTIHEGVWQTQTTIRPLGYRVIRLTK